MNKILSYLAIFCIAFAGTFNVAFAEDNPFSSTSAAALTKIKEYIETIAKFYGIDLTDASKYPATPNLNDLLNEYTQLVLNPLGKSTVLGASYHDQHLDQPTNGANQLTLTQQALNNILTTPPTTKNSDKCRYNKCIDRDTLIEATGMPNVPTAYSAFGSSDVTLNLFDLNTLLGPFNYGNNQIQPLQFIRLLTSTVGSFQQPSYSDLVLAKTSSTEAIRNVYKRYFLDLGQFAANYSVGLSNLNQMYARRPRQPPLEK